MKCFLIFFCKTAYQNKVPSVGKYFLFKSWGHGGAAARWNDIRSLTSARERSGLRTQVCHERPNVTQPWTCKCETLNWGMGGLRKDIWVSEARGHTNFERPKELCHFLCQYGEVYVLGSTNTSGQWTFAWLHFVIFAKGSVFHHNTERHLPPCTCWDLKIKY